MFKHLIRVGAPSVSILGSRYVGAYRIRFIGANLIRAGDRDLIRSWSHWLLVTFYWLLSNQVTSNIAVGYGHRSSVIVRVDLRPGAPPRHSKA